jgi:hypothetical protein
LVISVILSKLMVKFKPLHHFLFFKIYICMVYKQKVLGLLEVLEGKLRLIENVANGSMRMSNEEVTNLINQTKKVKEQLFDLISIERD